MKRQITTLFFLIFCATFSFAQYDIVDFEPAGYGNAFSWIVDANDSNPPITLPANPVSGGINTSATVAQFDAKDAGNDWALCYTSDIEEFMFDATNSTIKIKVYKTVISNVTIKLEGTSPDQEVAVANTVTGAWEELTFDFSAYIGNTYNKLVIIPDHGARTVDHTIYFDDIQVPDGNVVPTPEPTTNAPTPSCAPGDVISIYSDAYTDVTVDTWRTGWSNATLESPDFSVAGNNIKHYSALTFVGVETVTNTVDASGKTHFHIDIWTPSATTFKVKLVDFGANGVYDGGDDVEHEMSLTCFEIGKWVSYELALSDFTGLTTTSNIAQYIFSADPGNSEMYLDNIYFSTCGTTPASAPTVAASTPTVAPANVISMYSDAYTDVTVDTWETVWSTVGSSTTATIAGNDAKLYTDLTFVGIETTSSLIDASGMTYLSFEIWTPNMSSFKIKLVDFGANGIYDGGDDTEYEITYDCVTQNEWVKYNIPLTSFVGMNTEHIAQYIFTANSNAGAADLYLDNMAFSTEALPVELISFNAKAKANSNVLTWQTASEENNSHFEIQQSTDGIAFRTIGIVEGNGTTNNVSAYEFTDKNPAQLSYYRLRQIDFNDVFTFSDVVSVNRGKTTNSIKLYPNPVKSSVTVDYSSAVNEEILVTITDVTGRVVYTEQNNAAQGENQFNLDLSSLPQGSYFIRLESNSNTSIQTIIKQ